MRLTLGHLGDWIVDPRELASRLGVSSAELKRLQKRGQVDARIAGGPGQGDGRTRVTVRLNDQCWRGVFDRGGELIGEEQA